MFDKEYSFKGIHAEKVSKLTAKFDETTSLFERNFDVYMMAPIVGFLYGRKADLDKNSSETTKIFPDILMREKDNLMFNYRLIMLLDKNNEPELDNDEENDVDRTQLDYEEIYTRVLEIEPSLDYIINYVRQVPAPRTHEIANLMVQAKSGNGYARNRIIELMMKIAIKMALNFTERYHTDLGDTIQYAFEGLIIAYEKFEIGRQDNFTIYAPWWIRQNMDRTIDVCAGIHTPAHIDEQIKQVSELMDNHYCDNCTQYDVCPNLIYEICKKVEINEKLAVTYIMFLLPNISIEELVAREEEPVGYDTNENIIEKIHNTEKKAAVESVLETLTPRETKVLKLRFGLQDGIERTLEEVGAELRVTRERIRQIEAKAFKKLHHPTRFQKLKDISYDDSSSADK